MLYAIHAKESIYHGLYGMERFAVEDSPNDDFVFRDATEMSFDVMNDDSDIMDELQHMVDDYLEDNDYEVSEEEAWDVIMNENVDYTVYKIKECYQTEDPMTLEYIFEEDPKSFIKKYCDEL
jgi:hypothetical protein